MKEFNVEEAYKIYNEVHNLREACRTHCKDIGIECEDRYRHRLGRYEKEMEVENKNHTKVETTDSLPSAWDENLGRFLEIEEYCDKYGIDFDGVSSYKLVSHNSGHMVYNIQGKTKGGVDTVDGDKFESIVKRHIKPLKEVSLPKGSNSPITTTLTYTDVHVGMETNSEGNSIYGGKWNKEELLKSTDEIVKETILKSVKEGSNTLYIRDLGDLADGLNNQTTRGGHRLEQNMSNVEMFDASVEFKIFMVDKFVSYRQYGDIILHNVCNSNHGGDFDYFINSKVKDILELKYPHVKVVNHRKFMSHYGVGKHCFIISHGKDSKNMKFGMKPQLDTKAIEKIDNYIKSNNLYREYEYFTFCKGDSHQFLLDFTTSQDFNYFNYPALSPSSEWVQTNFKKGKRGFVVETFDKQKEEININYKYL